MVGWSAKGGLLSIRLTGKHREDSGKGGNPPNPLYERGGNSPPLQRGSKGDLAPLACTPSGLTAYLRHGRWIDSCGITTGNNE